MALTAAADSKVAPRDYTIVPKASKKIVARVPLDNGRSGNDTERNAQAKLVKLASNRDLPEETEATALVGTEMGGDLDIPQQDGLDDKAVLALIPPPPDPAPVIVKPVKHRSRREVCDTLTQAAEKNDLPVPFFIRLLFQESHFKPGVVSRAGAQGIAQFMPETSESVGLDNPFDPLEAIPASARLLRDLFQQFGNLGLAAAAYNAGPRRIQEWLANKARLPEETKGYVKKITGKPVESWTVATAGVPAIKLPPRAPCQDAAGLMASDGPETIPTPEPSPRTRARMASRDEKDAQANKKHTRHSGHKTAANKSDAVKPESGDNPKVAADQLAARRQRSAKRPHVHKHKREDLAAE